MGVGGSNHAASYIHLVHHLIEQCMLFYMSQEECAEALMRCANINPIVTFTVWKELEKENKDIFEAYEKHREAMAIAPDDGDHGVPQEENVPSEATREQSP